MIRKVLNAVLNSNIKDNNNDTSADINNDTWFSNTLYSNSDRELFINPFSTSPFLGSESITNRQIMDLYEYLKYLAPNQEEKIKELDQYFRNIKLDIDDIDKKFNDFWSSFVLEYILLYLNNVHKNLVIKNEWEGFLERVRTEWMNLYEKELEVDKIVKNIVIYVNDNIEKIDLILESFVKDHIKSEELHLLSKKAFEDTKDKDTKERKKDVTIYLNFLNEAENKYQAWLLVYNLMFSLCLLKDYIKILPNNTKKEVLKERYKQVEMLYFNYQRIIYYVENNISSDKKLVNILIESNYKARTVTVDEVIIANSFLFNKVSEYVLDHLQPIKKRLEDEYFA